MEDINYKIMAVATVVHFILRVVEFFPCKYQPENVGIL